MESIAITCFHNKTLQDGALINNYMMKFCLCKQSSVTDYNYGLQ